MLLNKLIQFRLWLLHLESRKKRLFIISVLGVIFIVNFSLLGLLIYLKQDNVGFEVDESVKKYVLRDPNLKLFENEEFRRLSWRAMELVSEQDADGASAVYQEIITRWPESPYGYNGLATIKLATENYDEAITLYKKALKLQSDSERIKSYSDIGTVYYSKKEYNSAIQYYQKALDLSDKYTGAIWGIALSYDNLRNISKAKEYYQKYIELVDVPSKKNSIADYLPYVKDPIVREKVETQIQKNKNNLNQRIDYARQRINQM